jgi:hypothetical protein
VYWTETPAACARQALSYVILSQPQTGLTFFGQAFGITMHEPVPLQLPLPFSQ